MHSTLEYGKSMVLYTYRLDWHYTLTSDEKASMPMLNLSRSTATFVVAPHRQVATSSTKHWDGHKRRGYSNTTA